MHQHPEDIRIDDYSYDLPQERIARYPLEKRDRSKMLLWDGKHITDAVFSDLPALIDSNSLLVFNNTRVIRARLLFRKESGAAIEIFCLEPSDPCDFAISLASSEPVEWKCLIGNLKRWKGGTLQAHFAIHSQTGTLNADKIRPDGDAFTVRFSWEGTDATFSDILEAMGHMPIPPYLDRDDEESDAVTYQTVYATVKGSVAAPTAGLHFTPAVFDSLSRRGIKRADITLHVSAGTFRPVKSEMISDHLMHTEHFFVDRETLLQLKDSHMIAIGTTTVRTLESIYWLGVQHADGRMVSDGIPSVSQWEPYDNDPLMEMNAAIDHILTFMDDRGSDILEARTDIIIVPGYRFRSVRGMLTNYHQPRSTLLLLVAAFTGIAWKEIYDHALYSDYRFLSYGDCMLLIP
jgi:S-adenosylmethionine:tRNA ribosyltransferase-isomerase